MSRDLKQHVGIPVERGIKTLVQMEERLGRGDSAAPVADRVMLEKLGGFYVNLSQLAQGYVKNPSEPEEQLS